MPRIRVIFQKRGEATYISHTDLPIIFGRAARRAGLVAEMTTGFSPHPRLALGPPLPIGVEGLAEPADFWFVEWSDEMRGAWAARMPDGIGIVSAREIPDGPSLSKSCLAASYEIRREDGGELSVIRAELRRMLDDAGALLFDCMDGEGAIFSVRDIERVGASKMVASLTQAGAIEGWADISLVRLAVGASLGSDGRAIALTGE